MQEILKRATMNKQRLITLAGGCLLILAAAAHENHFEIPNMFLGAEELPRPKPITLQLNINEYEHLKERAGDTPPDEYIYNTLKRLGVFGHTGG